MEGFRTEIVQNREVSTQIKGIAVGALLTGGYLSLINTQEYDPYLKYIIGTTFFSGVALALGFYLFRPKKIGSLESDSDGIKFGYQGTEVTIDYSQIRVLKLKYPGKAKWWNPLIYRNRNYIILETFGDDRFEFRIVLRNKSHKKDFNRALAAHREVITLFA